MKLVVLDAARTDATKCSQYREYLIMEQQRVVSRSH